MKLWPGFHDSIFFSTWQLCKVIAGQRYTKSLSTKQRQLQIAECKQSPQERRRICENVSWVAFDTCLQPRGILRSTFEPFQYALWPWNCRRWGLVSTTTIRWLLNLVLHFEISWLLLKAGFWALHRWFKLVLLVSNLVISPEFVYISAPHHCSGNFACQIKFWLWLDSYGHIQIDSVWVLSVLAGWVSHLGNSSVMCHYRGVYLVLKSFCLCPAFDCWHPFWQVLNFLLGLRCSVHYFGAHISLFARTAWIWRGKDRGTSWRTLELQQQGTPETYTV